MCKKNGMECDIMVRFFLLAVRSESYNSCLFLLFPSAEKITSVCFYRYGNNISRALCGEDSLLAGSLTFGGEEKLADKENFGKLCRIKKNEYLCSVNNV